MALKLEEMMNEFRYPSQITTDKAISTSAALTVGGALSVTGAVSMNGGLTATATTTLPATTVIGAAGVIVGALTPPANPTGVSASKGTIYINTTGTGVTNRMYVNTDGATAWTYFTTGA